MQGKVKQTNKKNNTYSFKCLSAHVYYLNVCTIKFTCLSQIIPILYKADQKHQNTKINDQWNYNPKLNTQKTEFSNTDTYLQLLHCGVSISNFSSGLTKYHNNILWYDICYLPFRLSYIIEEGVCITGAFVLLKYQINWKYTLHWIHKTYWTNTFINKFKCTHINEISELHHCIQLSRKNKCKVLLHKNLTTTNLFENSVSWYICRLASAADTIFFSVACSVVFM